MGSRAYGRYVKQKTSEIAAPIMNVKDYIPCKANIAQKEVLEAYRVFDVKRKDQACHMVLCE